MKEIEIARNTGVEILQEKAREISQGGERESNPCFFRKIF